MKSKGWLPFAVVAVRFPPPSPALGSLHSTVVVAVQDVESVIHIFEHDIETVSPDT
jgi:hypothetical protein